MNSHIKELLNDMSGNLPQPENENIIIGFDGFTIDYWWNEDSEEWFVYGIHYTPEDDPDAPIIDGMRVPPEDIIYNEKGTRIEMVYDDNANIVDNMEQFFSPGFALFSDAVEYADNVLAKILPVAK